MAHSRPRAAICIKSPTEILPNNQTGNSRSASLGFGGLRVFSIGIQVGLGLELCNGRGFGWNESVQTEVYMYLGLGKNLDLGSVPEASRLFTGR